MKTLMKATVIALAAASVLPACSSMGWGQKSGGGGSTHTMTGGAEAAPTDQATPQPAGPAGASQSGVGTQSGTSTQGGGAATQGMTGGAEAAPTDQATPQGGASQGATQGGTGASTQGGTPDTSGQSQGGTRTEQIPPRE